jgi:hypothetical protein
MRMAISPRLAIRSLRSDITLFQYRMNQPPRSERIMAAAADFGVFSREDTGKSELLASSAA